MLRLCVLGLLGLLLQAFQLRGGGANVHRCLGELHFRRRQRCRERAEARHCGLVTLLHVAHGLFACVAVGVETRQLLRRHLVVRGLERGAHAAALRLGAATAHQTRRLD